MDNKEIKKTIQSMAQMGVIKYGADHFGFSLNDVKKSEAFADVMKFVKQDERTGKFSFLSESELKEKGLSRDDLVSDLQKLGTTKSMFLATMNGQGDDLSTTNKILSNIEKLLREKKEEKKGNNWLF
jgi:hypothetical protein